MPGEPERVVARRAGDGRDYMPPALSPARPTVAPLLSGIG